MKRIEFYRSAKTRHLETDSSIAFCYDMCKLIHDLSGRSKETYRGKTLDVQVHGGYYHVDFRGHVHKVSELHYSGTFTSKELGILLDIEYKKKFE